MRCPPPQARRPSPTAAQRGEAHATPALRVERTSQTARWLEEGVRGGGGGGGYRRGGGTRVVAQGGKGLQRYRACARARSQRLHASLEPLEKQTLCLLRRSSTAPVAETQRVGLRRARQKGRTGEPTPFPRCSPRPHLKPLLHLRHVGILLVPLLLRLHLCSEGGVGWVAGWARARERQDISSTHTSLPSPRGSRAVRGRPCPVGCPPSRPRRGPPAARR